VLGVVFKTYRIRYLDRAEARFGEVVSREDLLAAGWPDEHPSDAALRVTGDHLERLETMAAAGEDGEVRRALFDLVAEIRGEGRIAAAGPNLRVVAGGGAA